MNLKVSFFLISVGLPFSIADYFLNKNIQEICKGDETCLAAGERCIWSKASTPPDVVLGTSYMESLDALNYCLVQNDQADEQIEKEDCVNDGPYEGGYCEKEVMILLTMTLEESSAAPIRCCSFKKSNSQKVTEDGNINIKYYNEKVNSIVTDQPIIEIYEEAFIKCHPKGVKCNVYRFKECLINQCISEVLKLEERK
ncbi:UNVERIFIED_CONTAM: hypothetical protein RMT77_001454 [Armadillidium vulgare]